MVKIGKIPFLACRLVRTQCVFLQCILFSFLFTSSCIIILVDSLYCSVFIMFSSTESCEDYRVAYERTFAIPRESPLLECPLQNLFPAEMPYNVTWFEERTGLEISDGQQNVSLSGTSLWFPNISMESQGTYVCVLRYERLPPGF